MTKNRWFTPTTDKELEHQERWFRKTLTELQKNPSRPRMIEGHLQQKFVNYIIRNIYGFWSWDIDQVLAVPFDLTAVLSILGRGETRAGWFYTSIAKPQYKELPLYLVGFDKFDHKTGIGWSEFKIYDKDGRLLYDLDREGFKEWVFEVAQKVEPKLRDE